MPASVSYLQYSVQLQDYCNCTMYNMISKLTVTYFYVTILRALTNVISKPSLSSLNNDCVLSYMKIEDFQNLRMI